MDSADRRLLRGNRRVAARHRAVPHPGVPPAEAVGDRRHRYRTPRHLLWSARWLTLKEALGALRSGAGSGSSRPWCSRDSAGCPRRSCRSRSPPTRSRSSRSRRSSTPGSTPFHCGHRLTTQPAKTAFPVFVCTLRGLTSVRPAQIELMRSYAAGEFAIFRRVRVPTALPFVFSAFESREAFSHGHRGNRERLLQDFRLARDHDQEHGVTVLTSKPPGPRTSP